MNNIYQNYIDNVSGFNYSNISNRNVSLNFDILIGLVFNHQLKRFTNKKGVTV